MLRLTQLRKQAGISQAELARRAGLHHSTLSLVESGRLVPYPSQLHKLAGGLGCADPVESLLDEVEGEQASD
jgi:transcriptional regulator with XRE-family HTH domain